MEHSIHTMSNLFAQLGKPNDELAISRFIETHAPLASGIQFHEVTFWTTGQANFLSEAISDDADWAAVADDLNTQLHGRH